MKKLLIGFLGFIFLSGCVSSNHKPVSDNKTYTYEIHTVGGICDTVITHSPINVYNISSNPYVKLLGVEYHYVDYVKCLDIQYN